MLFTCFNSSQVKNLAFLKLRFGTVRLSLVSELHNPKPPTRSSHAALE